MFWWGVGGWMVPLAMDPSGHIHYTVEDLARDTQGPVLLVAPNRLGVLNHIQLTIAAIKACGFTVQGVILNQITPSQISVAEKTNRTDLELLLSIPIAECPFISEFRPEIIEKIGLICRELGLIE